MSADSTELTIKTYVTDAGLNIKLPVIPLLATSAGSGPRMLSVDVTIAVKPFTVGLGPLSPQSWETHISLHDVTPALPKQVIEVKGHLPPPLPL